MPKKIAVLGDIYVDVHTGPLADLPVWNSDLFSQNIKFLVGGSAGNTSRCLGGFSRFDNIQALGVDSRLFSALGDDDVSQLVISKLSRERLTKTDGSVVTINGCTAPTSIVLYGAALPFLAFK